MLKGKKIRSMQVINTINCKRLNFNDCVFLQNMFFPSSALVLTRCLDDSHAHILRRTHLELLQQELLQQCLCPGGEKNYYQDGS